MEAWVPAHIYSDVKVAEARGDDPGTSLFCTYAKQHSARASSSTQKPQQTITETLPHAMPLPLQLAPYSVSVVRHGAEHVQVRRVQQQPSGPQDRHRRLRQGNRYPEAVASGARSRDSRPLCALLLLQGPPVPPLQRPHEAHQGKCMGIF